jgi:hypothetical protein
MLLRFVFSELFFIGRSIMSKILKPLPSQVKERKIVAVTPIQVIEDFQPSRAFLNALRAVAAMGKMA